MFNKNLLIHNRNRQHHIGLNNSEFIKFIIDDQLARLSQINRQFKNILLINPLLHEYLTHHLRASYRSSNITSIELDDITTIHKAGFDLIIMPFFIHWVDDVQKLLEIISSAIDEEGIFAANFPGERSLHSLRMKLFELESEYIKTHTPHIIPFITLKQVPALLSHAGFSEVITDMEEIELERDNILSFMKMLKDLGQSNVMHDCVKYSINKAMYKKLKLAENDTPFVDKVNLISLIASKKKNSIKLSQDYYAPH